MSEWAEAFPQLDWALGPEYHQLPAEHVEAIVQGLLDPEAILQHAEGWLSGVGSTLGKRRCRSRTLTIWASRSARSRRASEHEPPDNGSSDHAAASTSRSTYDVYGADYQYDHVWLQTRRSSRR